MQKESQSYIQEWLEVEGHKILKKVGWLSLEACVNHIIEQYAPLVSYFDSLESSKMPAERGAKMKAIRERLKKPITKAYLLFLSNSLSYVSKFNLLVQSQYSLPVKGDATTVASSPQ